MFISLVPVPGDGILGLLTSDIESFGNVVMYIVHVLALYIFVCFKAALQNSCMPLYSTRMYKNIIAFNYYISNTDSVTQKPNCLKRWSTTIEMYMNMYVQVPVYSWRCKPQGETCHVTVQI